MLAGKIADATGSYGAAYNVAGTLLACTFILAALSYIMDARKYRGSTAQGSPSRL